MVTGDPPVQPSNPHEPRDQQQRTHCEQTERHQRSKSADEIADAYADVADKIARWRQLDRVFAGRSRRRHFEHATGCELDITWGTGWNFRYVLSSSELVGTDTCDSMYARVRNELDRLDLEYYRPSEQRTQFTLSQSAP